MFISWSVNMFLPSLMLPTSLQIVSRFGCSISILEIYSLAKGLLSRWDLVKSFVDPTIPELMLVCTAYLSSALSRFSILNLILFTRFVDGVK